ncbi:sulfatase [Pelagicoccus sp. NFK12]|uniref:Sulfatase n=1 Tax=Pelagicoccus enzymogenes TaxID=2773457 RepID=A0A927IJJ4_9BACT|nr:sulfatase [Pelagicoccus enzymogenes]MBD5781605.1 sulfatase [Pelagicoccus enzymogenes]
MKYLLLAFVSIVGCSLFASAEKRPNVVLILADDLGYTDIGAFAERATGVPVAQQFFETPNLDSLAQSGVSFSQAYACPLCAPTRASVLTGKYASKLGFTTATPPSVRSWYNSGKVPPSGYMAQDAIYWGDPIKEEQALWNGGTLLALPSGQVTDRGRDEKTLAEVLNEQGYRSAFVGKWHLGGHGSKGYEPHDQGFEELAYYDAGGSPYFGWRKEWASNKPHHSEMPQEQLFGSKLGIDTGQRYLTDELTAQATSFIRTHVESRRDDPFFLYFCHFSLHAPLQAKAEDVDYFEAKGNRGWNGHDNATYAAMVRSLDESVGALLDTLRETNQLDNTLIVFMSDNGGVSWPLNQSTRSDDTRPTSNAPLKGGKAMVYEGGIRVPLFFYWKGKIDRSAWIDRPVDCNDIFPTVLEMSGVDVEPHYQEIDGRSLAGVIEGGVAQSEGYDRETFYWHYPFNVIVHNPVDDMPLTPHSAIRKGDYKLIFDWSGRLWLYDIERDLSESNNLVDAKPQLARELFVELNEWLAQNVEEKYYPTLNPSYDADNDTRDYPFVDLRASILGRDFAIRPKPPESKSHLVKAD